MNGALTKNKSPFLTRPKLPYNATNTCRIAPIGFITDDGSKDVFVHQSALTVEIAEGDKVSYDVEETEKGLNAVNAEVV